MASDYVDDLLRDERESFKRKEAAAKKFDNRLDNFRKSAQTLRDAARQLEEAFPGMSQRTAADKWAMTGTEKNIAFDAKGELVAAPAGRKPTAVEPEPADVMHDATGHRREAFGRPASTRCSRTSIRSWTTGRMPSFMNRAMSDPEIRIREEKE